MVAVFPIVGIYLALSPPDGVALAWIHKEVTRGNGSPV